MKKIAISSAKGGVGKTTISYLMAKKLKDTGLNDFDLATTKMYKGVKPMFEQLGFVNSNFNKPDEQVYWKNIIPTEFDYLNYLV